MPGIRTRRTWLRAVTRGGAAWAAVRALSGRAQGSPRQGSPNGKAGIGLIGCGERSAYAEMYNRHPGARIVAVCDPVQSRRDGHAARYGCPAFRDLRELLARPEVDAVHIATPDHWHVPAALLAAKAGKDIYLEKPLGLCLEQALAARAIVDRHQRVFQYGAQQRSQSHVRLGIELVLNGHIGEVKDLVVWAPHGEAGGSATPVLPVPEGFDYDLWLGPAPESPFCHDRCLAGGTRKGIYHIRDYAVGFLAGWGSHPMDMLQWWADHAGRGTIPVRYEGSGRLPDQGLFNTLTHWNITCTYADGLRLRFLDNESAARLNPLPEAMREKMPGHGTLFLGERGWVLVHRGGWKTSSEALRQQAKDPGPQRLPVSREQIYDFVDRVHDRGRPVDDLHSAVRSDLACHLSEIAIRTGHPVTWDPVAETIGNDVEARRLISRPLRPPWKLG
jgi:hypothetical protein